TNSFKAKSAAKNLPNRRCFQKLKRSNQTQRSASVMPKSSSVTRALTLLLMTACAQACSPKAQAQHQAKKAKYLAGETQPLGQKLGLSRGGVIMENVGVDRLRMGQVQKTMKEEARRAEDLADAADKAKAAQRAAERAAREAQAKKGFFRKGKMPPPNPQPVRRRLSLRRFKKQRRRPRKRRFFG
uniref:Signal peptide protein n=1 Tax=Macrostomum lignano TaxID=282301 RepID=A0A1I8GFN4_9PLAT